MSELDLLKLMQLYGDETELADFSPEELKELLEEKGITRYRLAKLADTRFEVVEKWCSGSVERIDSDVLARFCYILDCEIADIIKYNV